MAKGVRELSKKEIGLVAGAFTGRLALRNKALFLLQYYTGRRITQTLSLRIEDVLNEKGQVVKEIYYKRATTKGKIEGQILPVNDKARDALSKWLVELSHLGHMTRTDFVFQAQGLDNRPLTRQAAYRVYSRAFKKLKLEGRLGTHSLRKSFGKRVYLTSGKDIRITQEALGHKSLNSTADYLNVNAEKVRQVIMEAL